MSEERKTLASSGYQPTLIEPKEEPFDDISLMADDNEISNKSESFLKEPKEEPFDLDSFPIENENFHQYYMDENVCKKEELSEDEEYFRPPSPFLVKDEPFDEYTQEFLIPPWDAVPDQSARWNSSSAVVNVKEEVDSDDEPRGFMDDFNDGSILMKNDMSTSGNPSFPTKNNNAHMKNDEKLECPECKFSSKFVGVWIRHLKKKHSTSLLKANLLLRCSCGNESQTENHIRECNSTNNCVVRVNAMKENETELKCHKCKFSTHFVFSWLDHLKSKHSAPLPLEEVSLVCKCGNESLSTDHGKICNVANFTVIRRVQEGPATPQCVHCEKYPETVRGYAQHLYNVHNSSLIANKMYLVCSCGVHVMSTSTAGSHMKECAGCEFTLHNLDEKGPIIWNQGSIQCVLCNKFPTTSFGYVAHLNNVHRSTLIANGIYLRCFCGMDICSFSRYSNHSMECDGRGFSLHKVEMKIHSNPQCSLCEVIPSTVYGYAAHLNNIHKSSLKANGIYLRCSCGSEIRSKHRDLNHNEDCAGCEYTVLVELDEKIHHNSNQGPVQCVLCNKFPTTAYSYARHLNQLHKSTLIASGIYLRCSCGMDVRSNNRNPNHNEDCDGTDFTLHKLEDKVHSTRSSSQSVPAQDTIHELEMKIHSNPQCLLCDTIPSTAYGYADHLNNIHKSSLKANGIYLRCSCGSEIRSNKRILNHENCAGCEFTVYDRDEKGNELEKKVILSTSPFASNQGTIQCVHCEAYPISAYAYASHLKGTHKTTLASHGIYLLCSCGHEIRSHHRLPCHNKECDARNFTLHKEDDN